MALTARPSWCHMEVGHASHTSLFFSGDRELGQCFFPVRKFPANFNSTVIILINVKMLVTIIVMRNFHTVTSLAGTYSHSFQGVCVSGLYLKFSDFLSCEACSAALSVSWCMVTQGHGSCHPFGPK